MDAVRIIKSDAGCILISDQESDCSRRFGSMKLRLSKLYRTCVVFVLLIKQKMLKFIHGYMSIGDNIIIVFVYRYSSAL